MKGLRLRSTTSIHVAMIAFATSTAAAAPKPLINYFQPMPIVTQLSGLGQTGQTDGGCSCHVGSRSTGPSIAALALLGAMASVRRRRSAHAR